MIPRPELAREVMAAAESLGVQLRMSQLTAHKSFDYEVRVSGLDRPHGFAILIGEDYLSWAMEISMDPYGVAAVQAMRIRYEARRETLESVLAIASARSKTLTYQIDGKDLSLLDPLSDWSELRLELLHSYSSQEDCFSAFRTALLDVLCILLCLLVEDEVWVEENRDEVLEGKEEGKSSTQVTHKYERSRYNRALCLGYYGFTCHGCGILMESKYGPIGQNVIHVHHIVPVSKMEAPRALDPIKDLIPLCPNCHNVVHRTDPPMPLAELVKITGHGSE